MKNPMIRIRPFLSQTPVDVNGAIRSLGIRLKVDAKLPENISGQIRPVGDSYEIASTERDHRYRQRFTLAHELGHYILHRDKIGDGVDDNKMYRSTEDGNFYNTSIEKIHEMQANSFAASILMPEDLVRREINSGLGRYSLKALSNKFEVSPSAMRWRLKNLGLINRVHDD